MIFFNLPCPMKKITLLFSREEIGGLAYAVMWAVDFASTPRPGTAQTKLLAEQTGLMRKLDKVLISEGINPPEYWEDYKASYLS